MKYRVNSQQASAILPTTQFMRGKLLWVTGGDNATLFQGRTKKDSICLQSEEFGYHCSPPITYGPTSHSLAPQEAHARLPVRCQGCMRFPESSGKQRMKFCQGRNKPRQRREASPSRTLSEHIAQTKIEQRTDHCLPRAGFLFFSLSSGLHYDFFFSPARPSVKQQVQFL